MNLSRYVSTSGQLDFRLHRIQFLGDGNTFQEKANGIFLVKCKPCATQNVSREYRKMYAELFSLSGSRARGSI